MNWKEFSRIRHRLHKTQRDLSLLLGVSQKAVQSFEQGWRPVPVHVERQLLYLLARRLRLDENQAPCWEIKGCHPHMREHCPAWEFDTGHLCWFINGTVCRGKVRERWSHKMRICRRCEVFRPLIEEGIGGAAAE